MEIEQANVTKWRFGNRMQSRKPAYLVAQGLRTPQRILGHDSDASGATAVHKVAMRITRAEMAAQKAKEEAEKETDILLDLISSTKNAVLTLESEQEMLSLSGVIRFK